MGNEGARLVGMEKAATTIEESIEGVTAAVYSLLSQFSNKPFANGSYNIDR